MISASMISASIPYVVIDAILATIALVLGFVSALGYVRYTSSTREASHPSPDDAAKSEQANQTERADMAAQQLRDLSRNMAADVSDHNAKVDDFSSQLASALDSGDNGIVTDAIAAMVAANEKLQGRLAAAEQKIQAQAQELRTHESEARTDALTRLANRRAFDAALDANVDRFRGQKSAFSLLIFDVDHFKRFNDTHGHQAGDEVLRAVGRTLSKTVKSTDLACRYGGEEFAVIMPGTVVSNARIAAERVRKAIAGIEVAFDGKQLTVTASIGLAQIGSGETGEKLIRRADDAVYAAKAAGRNCSFWNDGLDCLPVNQESRQAVGAAEQDRAPAPKDAASLPETPSNAPPSNGSLQALPDRSVFKDELRRRISESQRFGVALSVMRIRVKDYETLESSYGPAVGRLLLDSVAAFVSSTLREMDLLAAYGRDEFAVMLPGSSENEAKQVGRRVKTAISNCVIPLGSEQVRLELHLGVSHVQPEDNADSLMDRAARVLEAAANMELVATSL